VERNTISVSNLFGRPTALIDTSVTSLAPELLEILVRQLERTKELDRPDDLVAPTGEKLQFGRL
jgi:hypothetical protein